MDGTTLINYYNQENYLLEWFKCSECGYTLVLQSFKYCPKCGRKITQVN